MGRGRCSSALRRVDCAAWLAILVLGAIRCEAAVIDSPPLVGDRKVVITWQPDTPVDASGRPDPSGVGDPFFTGNLVLEEQGVLGEMTGPIEHVAYSFDGRRAVALSAGEDELAVWWTDSLAAPVRIPLGTLERPTDFSWHESGRYLLGALPDGRVARWAFDEGGAPEPEPELFRISDAAVLGVTYTRTGVEISNQNFATISADDVLRYWLSPGEPGSWSVRVGSVDDHATGALEVSPTLEAGYSVFAAGTANGRVFMWASNAVGNSPPPHRILGNNDPHPGAVTAIAFALDQSARVVATGDDTGVVRLWPNVGQAPAHRWQIDLPLAQTPLLALSPPFGRLVYIGRRDGVLAIADATTGKINLERQVLPDLLAMTRNNDRATRLILGDSRGTLTVLRAGSCEPTPEQPRCFGGYMVWRSPSDDPADRRLTMLRTYTFGDSTWGFTGEVRSFADPDSIIPRWTPPVEQDPDEFVEDIVLSGPHNGVPYYYSVTRFDRVYLAGEIFAVFPDSQPGDDAFYRAIDRGFYRRPGSEEPTPIYPGGPARTETPHLGGVTVVPNPYEAGKVPWELGGSRHVEFRQLPEEATIRIYTVAGDFVRELKKGRGIHGESVNVVSWDLMNSSGREVSSGIYVFRIETPTGELEHGYFAIIL